MTGEQREKIRGHSWRREDRDRSKVSTVTRMVQHRVLRLLLDLVDNQGMTDTGDGTTTGTETEIGIETEEIGRENGIEDRIGTGSGRGGREGAVQIIGEIT